jgi:hypothetical protein
MLGLVEMQLLVKQAFDRGSIDATLVTYDHFVADLKASIDGASSALSPEFAPFGDIVEELADWSSFRP